MWQKNVKYDVRKVKPLKNLIDYFYYQINYEFISYLNYVIIPSILFLHNNNYSSLISHFFLFFDFL